MSGTVVFMKTHYAIFQLICVLRSVTESQGLIRNPQYSMRGKNNFNNHANEILIPHRGKKNTYLKASWASDHTVIIHCIICRTFFASMILFNPHDGNPRKWVLYEHPFFKDEKQDKTEQIL